MAVITPAAAPAGDYTFYGIVRQIVISHATVQFRPGSAAVCPHTGNGIRLTLTFLEYELQHNLPKIANMGRLCICQIDL